MPEISVILPVFNGQKYLNKCIESVLKQTYTDFEFKIVDDGSYDRTAKICDFYAASDKRVCIVREENVGVNFARWCAIKEAKGKYIAFIDADDWWDEEFLQTLYKELTDGDFDLVAGGCIQEYEDKKVYKLNNIPCGKYTSNESMRLIYAKMLYFEGFFKFGILPYMWNKLFKKELLLKAYERIDMKITDGEDVAVVMPYIAITQKVSIIEACQYHYRMHSGQTTANKGKNFYENVSRLYLNLKERMKDKPCYEVFLPQLDQYMRYMVWMGNPESFPRNRKYLFPYEKVPGNCRIILYAAGNIGSEYYKQLKETHYCEIAAWVDKNRKLYGKQKDVIESPNVIFEKEFDYIVVAIENPTVHEEVKKWLINNGIKAEIII